MADSAVPKPGEPGFIGPVPTTPTMLVQSAAPLDTATTSAGSTAQAVEVDLEELRAFCGGSLQRMRDDLDQAKRDFDGLPVSAWLFSEADPGRTMAQQHAAVHEVYSSTLAGLAADLERLQSDLRRQLDAYQDSDDAAAEVLLRLSRHMSTTPLTADTMRENAIRVRSGAAPAPAPAPAPTPTAPDAGAAPTAAPAPSTDTGAEGF